MNKAKCLGYELKDDEIVESDEQDETASYTTQLDGNITSTFYALVHIFEAAACKPMCAERVADGRFPKEIYNEIAKQVTDMETRESLMKVSRTFRRFCQEDLLFAEGLIIKPSHGCQSCDVPTRVPKRFEEYDTRTGTQARATAMVLNQKTIFTNNPDNSPVSLRRCPHFHSSGRSSWQVAIGTECNKKSLLARVGFALLDD